MIKVRHMQRIKVIISVYKNYGYIYSCVLSEKYLNTYSSVIWININISRRVLCKENASPARSVSRVGLSAEEKVIHSLLLSFSFFFVFYSSFCFLQCDHLLLLSFYLFLLFTMWPTPSCIFLRFAGLCLTFLFDL